jgi:hypothetical protein
MSLKLKERVAALERDLARLQGERSLRTKTGREWVDDLSKKFAGDPFFEKAMALGRKYRQALRPRHKRRVSKK